MNGKVFALEDDASISGLIRVALEMNGIKFEAYSNILTILPFPISNPFGLARIRSLFVPINLAPFNRYAKY